MAAHLLTYANRQKVAEALTERGYSVTRMTVNRWARGGEMPEIAARMILDLFGHTPDTTKSPPPEWAGEMESRLTDELRANRKVFVDTMASHFARLGVERVLDDPPQNEPDPETPAAETGPVEPR